jgi:predicted GNAT family acetyltransferase
VTGLRLVPAHDLSASFSPARELLRTLGVVTYGLHLGVLGQVEAGDVYDEAHLWWVREGQVDVGLVLRTPPHPYALALRPDRSAVALAAALVGARLPAADLTGPAAVVEPAARAWAAHVGGGARPVLRMHVLTCTAVRPPEPTPAGRARRATVADADVVTSFTRGFLRDALPDDDQDPDERAQRFAGRLQGDHGIHLWEDGQVVSMAAIGMPAEGGERIGAVYTPPAHRGRGYAGALVAAVTEEALDRGCAYVQLNTDVDNPVSNALYERLGYDRVGEQATWRIGAPAGPDATAG